jgi:TP53 regulating kinase-like protein
MLLKKGAEASLFLEDWYGWKVIMKRRLPKKYRLPEMDEQIRTYRTTHESQLLHLAKEARVPTPTLLMIDLADSNIIMEYVEGDQVKQILDNLSPEERQRLCRHIGDLVGHLHRDDIVHGDLTTSNMILTPGGRIVFVDFGLGEKTVELEPKAVDLHLMKRALQSTHFRCAEACFHAVFAGYTAVVGKDTAKEVQAKIHEIERRGRYVSERRQRKA